MEYWYDDGSSLNHGQLIYYMDYPCSEFDDCLDKQPKCATAPAIIHTLVKTTIIALSIGGAMVCLYIFALCCFCAQRKRAAATLQYQMFTDDTKY